MRIGRLVAVTIALAAPRLVGQSSPSKPPDPTTLMSVAGFKAAPFHDPATGLVFDRDRWMDPTTGSFVSPDRVGFRDSSNPQIYCGGDAINCSDPTGEYEADVHRVLTTYLALRAEFSPVEADEIGRAAESLDQRDETKPVTNARKGKWNVVLGNHFAIVPGERTVRRNSPAARRGAEEAQNVFALGGGIHLLQDSYSHEDAYVGNIVDQKQKYGGPSLATVVAAIKDPEHGIGHPDKPPIGSRADNHNTDQTWRDPEKAVEMARTTFFALVDYRQRTGVIGPADVARIQAKWARLENVVRLFARAKTKHAKKEWLATYAPTLHFTDQDLKDMSIDR